MPEAMKSSGNAPCVVTPAFSTPVPPPTTPKDENFQHTPPDSPGLELLPGKFIKGKAKPPVWEAFHEPGDPENPAQEDLKELHHALSKMAPNGKCNFGPSPVTMDQLKEIFESAVERRASSETEGKGPVKPENDEKEKEITRIRASKLESKAVREVWNEKAYEYKVVDSPPTMAVSELDEYVFVTRTRIDRRTQEPTVYIDIKSVEQNILYHFLPELEAHRESMAEPDIPERKHVDLLIQHLHDAYKPLTERLHSLLNGRKITYDLLWALFKPNMPVSTTCNGSGKPRCVKYDFGIEKATAQGVEYFEVNGRYLDFDGEVFGEATETMAIKKFYGAKRIENLSAFPLEYHEKNMREQLIACGRTKQDLKRIPVKGRIMIDAAWFRKNCPNYPRLHTKKPEVMDLFTGQSIQHSACRVNSNGMDTSEMQEDHFLICSPTVLGFTLTRKCWAEFAVSDVLDIKYSVAPFNSLVVPAEKKKVIMALAESVNQIESARLDDVIAGKGLGVTILLHGPPGVGKTLTAEAIAEHQRRPLYSVSAGELSTDAGALEIQFSQIFQIESHWNAILLLDEADVFVQQRSSLQLERNRLVAIFLRLLEYYDGTFFLTTNLVGDFDAAILDRVHLSLKYHDLPPAARKSIFLNFLRAAGTKIDKAELDIFAETKLNGRQIKNTVKLAHSIAFQEKVPLSAAHIRTALVANGWSIPCQSGLGFDESLYEE
ncbi:hypothetical protein ACJ73_02610 [Blastomyces percursus]|uniref:AAA+ ATPase domain-containing protein n=1 Tax=Blastomyces percursus TaxID=1658174 RepID=A0A1J9R0P8_9EURO|nr:hypothetical protein ACJ73_02610 [Blastomyces percursus]